HQSSSGNCGGPTADTHSFPTRRSSDLRKSWKSSRANVSNYRTVAFKTAVGSLVAVVAVVCSCSGPIPEHPDESASSSAFRSFVRSEEHTSELQSPCNLVCRLLLEKKLQ